MTNKKVCSVEDCGRECFCKGFCSRHYQKQREDNETRICSLGGCGSKHYSKSYCVKHYGRFMRHGDVNITLIQEHGYAHHPLYIIHHGMMQRCNKKSNKSYKHYGGRGIRVCDRWLDVGNFIEDMGQRPEGTSLDRIDNNGNYEPLNCRWATSSEQVQNTRLTTLTPELVRKIRTLHKEDNIKNCELARMFNTSAAQISRIVLNRSWANII